jgi:cobalt/nickel transport system ATP-binding protein
MSVILQVQDLSFAFDGKKPLLHDISFAVGEGESVGLVGANGAGKSTLLWCILGLHRATGLVRLFGGKPARHRLARVGVVFQNPEDLLFMPRLLDDLTLPLLNRGVADQAALARARSLLKQMGLEEYEDAPASQLSLGQRKRAAIASALITSPDLLLLDEPTAELDARSVRGLTESLQRIRAGCLITSHHLDFLRRVAARLLVLHEGTIIAGGTTQKIMADTGLLERAGLI